MAEYQDDLPSSRALLTSMLAHLSRNLPAQRISADARGPTDTGAPMNPLKNTEANERQLLVTMHCLLPDDFLPALDLLDRQLVTRLRIPGPPVPHIDRLADGPPGPPLAQPTADVVGPYYVRSAQQPSSRSRSRTSDSSLSSGISYEVRLEAWSCSCPAFVFSAFGLPTPPLPFQVTSDAETRSPHPAPGSGAFGGRSLAHEDAMPPFCKHLLACLLVERCPRTFGGHLMEMSVSTDEMAGWAAGWGG